MNLGKKVIVDKILEKSPKKTCHWNKVLDFRNIFFPNWYGKLGNCHLGSGPWGNAFGKLPSTVVRAYNFSRGKITRIKVPKKIFPRKKNIGKKLSGNFITEIKVRRIKSQKIPCFHFLDWFLKTSQHVYSIFKREFYFPW